MYARNSRASICLALALKKEKKAFMEYPAVDQNAKRSLCRTVNHHSKRLSAKRRRLFDVDENDENDDRRNYEANNEENAYECQYETADDLYPEDNDIADVIGILTPSKRGVHSTANNLLVTSELENLNMFVGGILNSFSPVRTSSPIPPIYSTPSKVMSPARVMSPVENRDIDFFAQDHRKQNAEKEDKQQQHSK